MPRLELSFDATTRTRDPDPVLAVDMAGEVIYVNRAAEAMTGRARDDMLGHPLTHLLELAAEATQSLAALSLRTMVENRRSGPSSAWILDRRRSIRVLVVVHAEPIHDRNGRVAGAVIVCRDTEPQSIPAALEHQPA